MGYYQSKLIGKTESKIRGINYNRRISQYKQSIIYSMVAPALILLFHITYYRDLDNLGFRLPSNTTFDAHIYLFYISIVLSILYFTYNIYAIYSFKKSPNLREESYNSLPYSIKYILPKSRKEKRFWNYVSLSAAVTEEIIYRGYFFYTIPIMIPSINIFYTLILSSLMFGIGHIYQGKELYKPMLAGLFLGFIYLSTGSLYIVILLHFTQDIVAKYITEEESTEDRIQKNIIKEQNNNGQSIIIEDQTNYL